MLLKFKLSMPSRGSWNGRWSGEEKIFVRFRNVTKTKVSQILGNEISTGFYYNFGDGWGANVNVSLSNPKEKKELEKKSSGFCGYDWMIDSILIEGKIVV